jgi:cellulose synthase/poly-beta-1,6-N-acetylglucosamine synthase-like glycosyltransferase
VALALTIVIPVWDQHVELLPRCLAAIANEHVDADILIVNNASQQPIDIPPDAREITLTRRHTIGQARNGGLAEVATPFVVFADADDEVAPGSLHRGITLLEQHPNAPGILGRSIVDEHEQHRRRGRTPSNRFRLASRYAPGLVPLFWLVAFQASITTTILRTAYVRDAGGFPDTNISEDWHLAARLARRGNLICLDDPVRIYHRHPAATRITDMDHPNATAQRQAINADCLNDPAATTIQRLAAQLLLRSRKRVAAQVSR